MKLRKSFGILGATVALLALGAQPMMAAGGLRIGAEPAAAPSSFGSKLDSDAFPSNAYTGWECPDPGACTHVMNRAYNGGTVAAPRSGYIDKIKIAAGEGGTFRLFFVKVKPGTDEAKAMRKGPAITYQGQPGDGDPMVIETFNIPDLYIEKGWRLAVKGEDISFMRCNSGNGNFTYQPSLVVGDSYREADSNGSCEILIKAIYR